MADWYFGFLISKESEVIFMNTRIGQQLGSYRLLRQLGQGGFAEVYLAEHIHLKTPVAVKLLYGKLTAQDIAAFTTEAQTVARLSHPHILRILDFGFTQTLPFLVMDYAPGGTLRDRHASGSLVPLPHVVFYIKQVAQALAYAHTNKLIHRDVKPENMLLSADGSILLSDFGIVTTAHSTASMKTIDNTGTVAYMAPEQIKGKPRPASDQYALAICIYEWLCGERPFLGDTPIEIAMRHLSDDPPSLCQRVPALPLPVEQIIFKALAKDPSQRFPDILAFSSALELCGQAQQDTLYRSPSIPTQQGIVAPLPQQSLSPTVPANPMTPLQPPQMSVEEEILETYLQSLVQETYYSSKRKLAEQIRDFIEEHATFFYQRDQAGRLLAFYDRAIQAASQGPESDVRYYGDTRNIFIKQKVKCLTVFGNYEPILELYLQFLAQETYYSSKRELAEQIRDFIEEHATFFDRPEQTQRLLTFCDRAIQAASQGPESEARYYGDARNIFIKQKAKYLKLLHDQKNY